MSFRTLKSSVLASAAVVAVTFSMGTSSAVPAIEGNAQEVDSLIADVSTPEEAQDLYENLDVEELRGNDPEGFDQRVAIFNQSAEFNDFLDMYSVDPEGEKERLAALTVEQEALQFVEYVEAGNVDDSDGTGLGSPGVGPQAECWKSYVGIGAFSMVTGAACAAMGGIGAICALIAAGVGDNIDWDQHC